MKGFNPTAIVGGIGVVCIGILGYHTLYARQLQQVRTIEAQVAQEHRDQQVQQEVAKLLEQLERQRKRLPPEPDPSWLVREVVSHGQQAGLQLTSITQQPSEQQASALRLAVNLQVQASYHQLGRFLDSLERSESFIKVDKIELSNPNDNGVAVARLMLSTIYLPPVTQASAPTIRKKEDLG